MISKELYELVHDELQEIENILTDNNHSRWPPAEAKAIAKKELAAAIQAAINDYK